MNFFDSIILYGKNSSFNLEKAYDTAVMVIGGSNEKYIRNNAHPDFLLISKDEEDTDIPIEKTRYINEFLSICSEFGGSKVVIIANADDMNKNAANALLKTLEEPPAGSTIILTTTRLFSILPTIRSRCKKIFTHGQEDSEYSRDDPFFLKCLEFFDKKDKNIANFAKSINKEDINKFTDIAMKYSYCKCMHSASLEDAEKYIELSDIVEKSKNTHLDPYSLAAACCCLV